MATTIGAIAVNLHTVDRDEVVYSRTGHTVSHPDVVSLRRTEPGSGVNKPLRTNVRFSRGFPVGVGLPEKEVTVSIAVTVPPGVTTADVKTYVAEALTESATVVGEVGVTGDIHLGS